MNFYSKLRIFIILLIVSVSVSNSLAQEVQPDSLVQKVISKDSLAISDSLVQNAISSDSLRRMGPLVTCSVTSISPSSVSIGPDGGQVSPSVVVNTSPSNCVTYSIYASSGWIHYQVVPGRVIVTVDALYGATRYGSITIGSYTLNVTQTCGSSPVAPSSLSVNRNNFCSNAGGTITLTANGGSGVYTRWFTGSCGGTQVGYTGGASLSIAAPTSTTTYYGRWETGCGNSACSPSPITVTVNQPPVISSISGTTPVCPGSTYRYTASNTGLTTYSWSIPSGASGSSSTYYIDVTFGTTSGNVSVSGTDANGCTSNTASYGVTISYLTHYTVSGGGTTCPGVGMNVGLLGTTNGVQYKCYLNGSFQAPPLTGNGGALWWSKSSPGTYTITGINGSCEIPMDGSAIIYNNTQSTAPSSIYATVNPICKNGAGTTLTPVGGGLGTGASWKWYTGACGTENGGTLVYTGSSCPVNPQSTTIYWVRAEGTCNNTTCANITVTVLIPPVVTQHPTDVTICAGASTSFSVSATGATSYQWQNLIGTWTNISGATSSTYSISNTTGMDGRGFQCVVTGSCSFTTTSNAAYIHFSYLYPYTVHSQWTTICPGDANEITLDGSSTNTSIWYTCYLNGSTLNPPVHDATGQGRALSFGNHNQAGTYIVKAVNTDGCVISMNGSPTLTVKTPSTPASSITANPNSICPNGNPGGSSTLTLNGGSLESGAGVWHWYSGSTPCGSTNEGTNITSITVSPNTSTYYSVRAEGGCVITPCVYVQLNVKALPTISTQPVNSNVSLGSDATFSLTVAGPNLQYQWQVSPDTVIWTDLSGLPAQNYQTANLTIKGSTTFEDNYYRCRITSDCSTIYSKVVKIVLLFPGSGYLYGSDIPDPETRELNTSYLVGATSGSFNINPMGGSSYSIPLETPPGVNGLTPSLSVVYSSNSGAGIAGYGWQIAGLSSINRGPKTFYNDGRSKGVDLDTTDRFYLDGQRLVNTISSYGASDALYQTENDIFTRVTPQSIVNYSPSWFKTETKSGLVYEYGNTNVSKQKISGYSNVLSWYVSKVRDQFGHNINYAYIQDHGSIYPSEITYGPSSNPTINTITFYYKQRSDKNTSFLKGAKIEQWLLLDKIIIKYNSNIVKTYEFKQSYQGSNSNSYTFLSEVIEYGVGSSRLNSTAFSYNIPQNVSFQQTTYNTTHDYITYKSSLITGDFNGDGKADFLCLPDTANGAIWTGLRIYFGDGNDNFNNQISSSFPAHSNKVKDIRAYDINGDGIDDVLYEYTTPSGASNFYYMLCNGSTLTQPVLLSSSTYSTHAGYSGKARRTMDRQEDDNERTFNGRAHKNPTDADYNGDGVNDIFINNSSGNWIIYSMANSNGQLTSNWNTLGSGTISTMNGDVLSGDFNGDGKADLWSFEDTGVKIYTLNGSSLDLLYSSNWPTNKHFFYLGDFNGDGKVDVFLYGYGKGTGTEYDWSNWQIQLSTGAGFVEHDIAQRKTNLKNDNVRIGDFNGDGATDIMVNSLNVSWTGTYFYISKDNGTDFYTTSLPSYPIASHKYYLGDYNGDGVTDFICTDGVSPWWTGYQVYKNTNKTKALLNKVANGLGFLTKLSYVKLSEASPSIYQRGTGATFPVMEFHAPLDLVDSVQIDNGKGTMNIQTYYYEGAKLQIQGKGFLGFSKTISTDITAGTENENRSGYDPIYYYPKLLQTLSRRRGLTETIDEVENTYSNFIIDSNKKRIFPYIQSSVQSNSLTGHSTTTNFQYNRYGDPTLITKIFSNGPTEVDSINYDNIISSSKWLLGRPILTRTKNFNSDTTIIRTSTKVFNPNKNQLSSESWYSGTSNAITKSYVYYSNGTLRAKTATAGGISRSDSCKYESDSIRIYTTKDQLSHVTTNSYDNYGRLYTQKDFLGNTLTYQYDDLGRTHIVQSTEGSISTTTYSWHDPTSDPIPARYSVEVTGNDGSQNLNWYDKLGRSIRDDIKGFDGTMIYTTTIYNTKGQIESVSEPYYSGGSTFLNTFAYDDFGRKTSITRPSGRNTYWDYNNNIVTETTGGKSFYKTYSSDGTISSATDNGGTINYVYYPDGKARTITAPGGYVTKMYYDLAGNQKKLVDPSAGTISYTYNGFGELQTQVSPGNPSPKTTTIYYNQEGTICRKVTPEGTTKYRYNPNKQLSNVASPGNISRTFVYDTNGRISSITDTIPLINPLLTLFGYDNIGRKRSISHPSGITEYYAYNSNGYLDSISAGGAVRWQINSMNARQQITSGKYANNLNATFGFDEYGFPSSIVTKTTQDTIQYFTYLFTPTTGNLEWRNNNKHSNLNEGFAYDNLDRLIRVQKNDTSTFTYDGSTASILSKSDAGTFKYEDKPYSISSIDPSIGFTPADTIDAQSIDYNSSGKVTSIIEKTYEADFIYNSDNERVRMIVKQNGTSILSRWYSSDYINEIDGGTNKVYTFIGGDAYSAPVVAITQGGTTTYYDLLRDNLGSITHVVNSSTNTLVAEYSYDAWGRMRNPATRVIYDRGSEPSLFVAGRGFTGHEHLPWFNLINMNGRVYDPLIAMFLSPDNNVQAPNLTQNFNRYTYCVNNPLKYTDQSGEIFGIDDAILGLIGGTINVLTNLGNIHSLGQGLGYFGVGFASGALSEYISPIGSAALMGAGNAALGSYINTGHIDPGAMIQGAVTSGIVSGLTMGLGGLLPSTALSGIASPVLRGAITQGILGTGFGALGGGLSSIINGSNFWQGAGQGALWGGGIGFATGAYSGFQYANKNNIDPWSGESTIKETPTSQTPQAKGKAGEERAVNEIKSQGGQVLARHVTLEVDGVRVVVDIAADFNGEIQLIEVKNGPSAGFTPNQKIVYPKMIDGIPIIPRGANAVPVWGPAQISQPTTRYILKIIKY